MSAGEMNTSLTREETHSLDGNDVEDSNSAATGLSAPIMSEEVARQIRAATDPSAKQLEMLCNLLRKLLQDTVRHDEGTSVPAEGSSGPRAGRYDIQQQEKCVVSLPFSIFSVYLKLIGTHLHSS